MMAAHDSSEVVEIERMRCDTIDQRGIECTGAPRRTEDQRRPRRGSHARDLEQYLRAGLQIPRQSDTDRIENAGSRRRNRPLGELTLVEGEDMLRQSLEQRERRVTHIASPFLLSPP